MKNSESDNLSMYFSTFVQENNFKNGFLPQCVPGIVLPDSLFQYYNCIQSLSEYFSVSCDGVRPWLDKIFSSYDYTLDKVIDKLTQEEKYEFLTILSILIQSYRWDKCPPASAEYKRNTIIFPKGLYTPWKTLSHHFSLPLSNTYYSIIASNWTLKDKKPGDLYTLSDMRADNIKLLYSWLKPPYEEQLAHFLLSFVELESFGALVIDCITKAFSAIWDNNLGLLKVSLSELDVAINQINRAFNKRIKIKNISIEDWKEIIHIPFGWGIIRDGKRLEGANGMQVGTLAMLNSFFGIASDSSIGKATLGSRVYLLPKQRKLLEILDNSNVLRTFVMEAKNTELTTLYNKNLDSLVRWRVSHQRRGHKYLAHPTNEMPQMATGLTLPDAGNSIDEIFYDEMEDRITETRRTMV